MPRPKQLLAFLSLLLASMTAFSHPGHADGAPLIHAMSHGLHYLVVLIAAGIWTAQSVSRMLRTRADRKRSSN